MRTHRWKWAAAMFLLAIWAVPEARAADTVETVTGMRFRGKIVSQTDAEVSIMAWGSEVKLELTRVHAITRDGKRTEINPRKTRSRTASTRPRTRSRRTYTRTPRSPPKTSAKPKKMDFIQQLRKNGRLPTWVKSHRVNYDTGTPWSKARKDIRTKLANQENKDAVRLTFIYAFEKPGSPGKGEWALYLLLGGMPLQSYNAFLQEKSTPWGNGFMSGIAWGFQDYKRAETHLKKALTLPRKYTGTRANAHIKLGDLYADTGNPPAARAEYQKAISLTQNPKTFPPWGAKTYMNPRKKAQVHLDMLSFRELDLSGVRDGTYNDSTQGYSGIVYVRVAVKNGKMDVQVTKHMEKIDQNAAKLIPKKMIETQQLTVDAITGGTVTTDAIKVAAFKALKQGGLK